MFVFTFVSCDLNSRGNHALCLEDQFILALVKLRLNLLFEDIAHRFGVSLSTASCTFSKWIDILFTRLHFLIAWPQKEVLLQNMPPAFSQLYPRCVSSIVRKFSLKLQIHSLPVQPLIRTTKKKH